MPDAAFGGQLQGVEQLGEGGLAAAVAAQYRHEIALGDVKGDVVHGQRGRAFVFKAYVPRFDDRIFHGQASNLGQYTISSLRVIRAIRGFCAELTQSTQIL